MWLSHSHSPSERARGIAGWLSDRGEAVSGIWHPARPVDGAAASRTRVPARYAVLCPSVGGEQSRCRRGFRHLAAALAEQGIPSLRLEYPGTSHSAGDRLGRDHPERGLVDRWVGSIGAAVASADAILPNARRVLVGRRFGALLAAEFVNAGSVVVDDLLWWQPTLTGAAFVKELRALEALREKTTTIEIPTHTSIGLEVQSFAFVDDTVDAMRALELTPRVSSSRRVIAIAQPASKRLDSVLAQWRARGSTTDCIATTDAAFRDDDWFTSLVPTESISAIVRTIFEEVDDVSVLSAGGAVVADELPAGLATDTQLDVAVAVAALPSAVLSERHEAATTPVSAHASIELSWKSGNEFDTWQQRKYSTLIERAVRFGERDEYLGFVTRPSSQRGERLGVILLRALGENDSHVPLARHWATLGVTVLRVDVGGKDESSAVPGAAENDPYSPHAPDDVVRISAWFSTQLPVNTPIVMLAYCAEAVHVLAAVDRLPMVQGVMVINPPLYWTPEYDIAAAPQQQLSFALPPQKPAPRRSFAALLQRLVEIGRSADAPRVLTRAMIRRLPSKPSLPLKKREPFLSTNIEGMFSDRVQWKVIFGKGDTGLLHLEAQGPTAVDRLRDQAHVDLSVIEGADHLFATRAQRVLLDNLLTEYLIRTHL